MSNKAINWAFDQPITRPVDKLVLVVIANRANEHWAAFPGKAEIARKATIAESSVVHCVRRLEQGGFLMRVPFEAAHGQDQKIGYILAGGPRMFDEIDTEYLELAFADRKQAGAPKVAKPAHWSGARKSKQEGGQGYQTVTLAGLPTDNPQGDLTVTPRTLSKNQEGEETEQPGAVAQAPDKSVAPSNPAAIAEVRAAAPTPNRGSSTPEVAKIPKQRQLRPSNEKRDANWRAQIVAADVDELDDVLSTSGHGKSARRMSSFRLGFGTRGNVPDELYPQHVRHAYLYLLKDVAETDPEHLDDLKYALDESIEAGRAPYKWDHTEHVPAGETAAAFSARMIQVAASMPPEQLGPWAAEIEDFLPGLWYEKRHEAREQVTGQGLPLEIETIASVAVRLMIQHYTDKPHPKWPAEVVPPSMRTVTLIAEAPSWAA